MLFVLIIFPGFVIKIHVLVRSSMARSHEIINGARQFGSAAIEVESFGMTLGIVMCAEILMSPYDSWMAGWLVAAFCTFGVIIDGDSLWRNPRQCRYVGDELRCSSYV